jgi:hypothetical protein
MPYSSIVSVLVLAVVLRFVVAGGTRVGTRLAVVAMYSASLVLQFGFPQWQVAALLVQGMLGIGLLIYEKLAVPPPTG